jgi:nitroreductase
MDLLDVMRTTGAVRSFTPQAVPDEVLYDLLDAARFAPNGGNRQGWRVIVVKDAAIKARLVELNEAGAREYVAHVREGLVPFAPSDGRNWRGPAVDLEEARATPSGGFGDVVAAAPVLLLVVVDLGTLAVTDNGLDRQSIVGGGSVYPFCHNILLAARNVGLGGVMTTLVVREEPAVRELMNIPDGYAIAALLILGHPVKQVSKLRRAPVDEFTVVDTFTGRQFTR